MEDGGTEASLGRNVRGFHELRTNSAVRDTGVARSMAEFTYRQSKISGEFPILFFIIDVILTGEQV